MTLIALHQHSDEFWCYADTMVTFSGHGALKKYCKLFVLPIRYRCGDDEMNSANSHALGMGIAGNLAAATATYGILSGLLQSLYSFERSAPPAFNAIVGLAQKVAAEVYDDVSHLGHAGLFGFFLFGFDPQANLPRAQRISVELNNRGTYEIQSSEVEIKDHLIVSMGSGSEQFHKFINEPEQDRKPASHVFYDFIASGRVSSVGGVPQVLTASRSGVSIEPVLLPVNSGKETELFHSGIRSEDLGQVGDFRIGHTFIGFKEGEAFNRQWLERLGYDPDDPDLTHEQKNQAAMEATLTYASSTKGKVSLSNHMAFPRLKPRNGDWYFSVPCRKCFRLTPLFHDPSLGENTEPFDELFLLSSICIHCGSKCTAPARNLRSKIWKS